MKASAFIKYSNWWDTYSWDVNQKNFCSSEKKKKNDTLNLADGGSDPILSGRLRSLSYTAQDRDLILCYCWKFIFSLMWKQQNQQWQFNFPRPTTVQPLLSLNHTHLLICVSTHPRKVGAKSSLRSISLTLAWLPVRHFNLISFPELEAVLIVKKSRTGERYPHVYTHTHTYTYIGTWRCTGLLRQG